jgi:hypothetical protein
MHYNKKIIYHESHNIFYPPYSYNNKYYQPNIQMSHDHLLCSVILMNNSSCYIDIQSLYH